jgi:YVTN family beta-propeller protein
MTDHRHGARGGPRTGALFGLGLAALAAIAAWPGCGDDTTTGTGTGASGPGSGGAGGATTTTNTGGATTTSTGGGGSGPGPVCDVTQPAESRGSAVAVSPDDSVVVVANRDVGSVTIFKVDYGDGLPALTKSAEVATGAGSEPWQVVIDGCDDKAYVVLRKEQKLVEIDSLKSNPAIGRSVAVGSEPTGVAISPNNTEVYVANWVEGTVSVVDAESMTVKKTVDLNQTLIDTGRLGTGLTSRPALAHPRAIAVTNDGDANDDDEKIVVTEFFGQRIKSDGASGVDADTAKVGMLYVVDTSAFAATSVDLPNVPDTGFKDHTGAATGCWPNQVASVTVKGAFAYATSTCASPKGPIGVFQKGTCTATSQCASISAASVCTAGLCTLACTTDADCGFGAPAGTCNVAAGGQCGAVPTDVKATHHPALSIVDLGSGSATTTVLDAKFNDPSVASARMPLLPTDIGFFGNFGYLTAQGADAAFRIEIDGANIVSVGSAVNDFIDMRKDPTTDAVIKLPIGIAVAHGADAFAFVATEGSREVEALNLSAQAIAGSGAADLRVAQSTNLPQAGSEADKVLRGKRFFTTGLGRWSLGKAAWGSCAGCHWDGLTDNVTWYFARGPRQSTSLDGTFASNDPSDQRILNWTAIFDEIADFEANTRGISGGLGAIVDASNNRINTAAEVPQQQGLQGSSRDVADKEGTSSHPHSSIDDWEEIESWIKTIRSPRRPAGLDPTDVQKGHDIFVGVGQGNCVGCHSGAKWTISKVFWTVGDDANEATACPGTDGDCLGSVSWNINLNSFPTALLPVDAANLAANSKMRFGAPPGAEQMQCILRPVGTFGVSPAAVGFAEVRQDMVTPAQGNAATGLGYNPPSLLGTQTGAPFFHAGGARTLEEVFDESLFAGHHRSAIASTFTPTADQKRQLIAYLLSIDEDQATSAIPAKSNQGGDLCFWTNVP